MRVFRLEVSIIHEVCRERIWTLRAWRARCWSLWSRSLGVKRPHPAIEMRLPAQHLQLGIAGLHRSTAAGQWATVQGEHFPQEERSQHLRSWTRPTLPSSLLSLFQPSRMSPTQRSKTSSSESCISALSPSTSLMSPKTSERRRWSGKRWWRYWTTSAQRLESSQRLSARMWCSWSAPISFEPCPQSRMSMTPSIRMRRRPILSHPGHTFRWLHSSFSFRLSQVTKIQQLSRSGLSIWLSTRFAFEISNEPQLRFCLACHLQQYSSDNGPCITGVPGQSVSYFLARYPPHRLYSFVHARKRLAYSNSINWSVYPGVFWQDPSVLCRSSMSSCLDTLSPTTQMPRLRRSI